MRCVAGEMRWRREERERRTRVRRGCNVGEGKGRKGRPGGGISEKWAEGEGPGVAGDGPGAGGRDARGANGRPGPATRRAGDRSLGCQVSCHVGELGTSLRREQRPECCPSHMRRDWMDGWKTSLRRIPPLVR